MRSAAFAAGLQPSEFWSCTPHEVSLACRARGIWLEDLMQIAAWHVAHVLNIVTKKGQRITPDKLLGKKRQRYVDGASLRAGLTRQWLESEGAG